MFEGNRRARRESPLDVVGYITANKSIGSIRKKKKWILDNYDQVVLQFFESSWRETLHRVF